MHNPSHPERRYFTDAYTRRFSARVAEIEAGPDGSGIGVVLDGSYFYPASGGQPADLGRLGGVPVVDVALRDDEQIVHQLAQLPAGLTVGDEIAGEIDWERRFDHMQQHTGQHILSEAFQRMAGAATVGFHLSDNSCTIDLDNGRIAEGEIAAAEALANRVVWENRPVAVRFVTVEEAARLPLRKRPLVNGEYLRLVDIAEFDLNACGGTHVRHTGEVGLIKITRREKRTEKLRIHFACGGRALADYALKNSLVGELMQQFTTGAEEIPAAVEKLQAEHKALARENRRLRGAVLEQRVAQLVREALPVGGGHLIAAAFAADEVENLQQLGGRLANALPDGILLLGLAGEKGQLLFKRGETAVGDMRALIQAAFAELGSGSGGGTEAQAQGGGFSATPERLQQLLESVGQTLH